MSTNLLTQLNRVRNRILARGRSRGREAHVFYREDGIFVMDDKRTDGPKAVADFYGWRQGRGDRTARHLVSNFYLTNVAGDCATLECVMCLYDSGSSEGLRGPSRVLGLSPAEDIISKDDYQMESRAQADKYRSDDHDVIVSGRSRRLIDEPRTTPEGKIVTLLMSKAPLRDSDGDIFGVLGTYLDITERVRFQPRTVMSAKSESARDLLLCHSVACNDRLRCGHRLGQRLHVGLKVPAIVHTRPSLINESIKKTTSCEGMQLESLR